MRVIQFVITVSSYCFIVYSLPLEEFITNEAIQCTEVYEYAQSLSNPGFFLPMFQVRTPTTNKIKNNILSAEEISGYIHSFIHSFVRSFDRSFIQ